MLYEVFDKFLQVSTWYTRHPNDEERFFTTLALVVRDPNFNPDALGEYMRNRMNVSRDDEENHYNMAIDDYVSRAWAVKDYLRFNRL